MKSSLSQIVESLEEDLSRVFPAAHGALGYDNVLNLIKERERKVLEAVIEEINRLTLAVREDRADREPRAYNKALQDLKAKLLPPR